MRYTAQSAAIRSAFVVIFWWCYGDWVESHSNITFRFYQASDTTLWMESSMVRTSCISVCSHGNHTISHGQDHSSSVLSISDWSCDLPLAARRCDLCGRSYTHSHAHTHGHRHECTHARTHAHAHIHAHGETTTNLPIFVRGWDFKFKIA